MDPAAGKYSALLPLPMLMVCNLLLLPSCIISYNVLSLSTRRRSTLDVLPLLLF